MADVHAAHSLVRCLHCGARDTRRALLPDGAWRIVCPSCGPFRISPATEAMAAEPPPGSRQGSFVLDGNLARWLVVE